MSVSFETFEAAIGGIEFRDRRIAEAERIMRAELIVDVGQRIEQHYCMVCGMYGDKPEAIEHSDCTLAQWLSLS
jgi:hypothetical protein